MKAKIYLDNNATTFIDPRVYDAVTQALREDMGNPSSVHSFGQKSRSLLTKARSTIATFFNVKPNEVIFTSNGTEAINMVIKGLCDGDAKGHIITSSVEHSCIYSTVKLMETKGCQATYLSPGLWGAVTYEMVRTALRPNTRLIALMAVNNETGVKTDVVSIAALAKEMNIPLLVDGIAWLGKESVTIPEGISAICFSGHKVHAPKGTGLAIVRTSLKMTPLLTGGEQEFSRRGGTENVAGIVGFAKAIELLESELPAASQRMQHLRDRLEKGIMDKIPDVLINGQGPRIVNTSNLCFQGIEGEDLLTLLDLEGVAVSHGSACASGALEPSRILINMGLSMADARSSVRISLSRFTTEKEINQAIEVICKVVSKLRK